MKLYKRNSCLHLDLMRIQIGHNDTKGIDAFTHFFRRFAYHAQLKKAVSNASFAVRLFISYIYSLKLCDIFTNVRHHGHGHHYTRTHLVCFQSSVSQLFAHLILSKVVFN